VACVTSAAATHSLASGSPYFRFCASAFSDLQPNGNPSATMSMFAGIFAGIYLFCECLLKLAASALWDVDPEHGSVYLRGVGLSVFSGGRSSVARPTCASR
jgi:hypothetical protein